MMLEIAVLITLFGLAFWFWQSRSHREGMLAANASGALFELGLDVRKLPEGAKAKFFRECHAIENAAKASFPPRKLAIMFFGWYCTEYHGFDSKALIGEGRMLQAFVIMRQWAAQDARLESAAQSQMTAIFRLLYDHLESASGDRGELISQQLQLMEFARANGLEGFGEPKARASMNEEDALSRAINLFKDQAANERYFDPNPDAETLSWATGIFFYAALITGRNVANMKIHSTHWNTLLHRMAIEMMEEHDVEYPEREALERRAYQALNEIGEIASTGNIGKIEDHLIRVFGGRSKDKSQKFPMADFLLAYQESARSIIPAFMARLGD